MVRRAASVPAPAYRAATDGSVLADLALEVESALALGMRVAAAFDAGDRAFARIAVALAKFLNNKRCPAAVYEAMECLGARATSRRDRCRYSIARRR